MLSIGKQLANSPVNVLEARLWKVVTLSHVQINLCLLAFTFNYSAEHVLNHSTTEGYMLEDGMCCGWVLLDCTELRLRGSTYWTLLKGMLSSVWFCSIPGSLFSTPPPPPLSLHFPDRVPLTTAFQQMKTWMGKQHRCGCRSSSISHQNPLILRDVSNGDISAEAVWVFGKGHQKLLTL